MQDVRRFIGGAVIFDQRFANFFRTRANQLQLALQEKTQTVDGIDVERVTHCDHKAALAERDRDYFEAPRIFAPDFVYHLWWNDHRRDVDPIHVCLRSERARDVHVGQTSVVD